MTYFFLEKVAWRGNAYYSSTFFHRSPFTDITINSKIYLHFFKFYRIIGVEFDIVSAAKLWDNQLIIDVMNDESTNICRTENGKNYYRDSKKVLLFCKTNFLINNLLISTLSNHLIFSEARILVLNNQEFNGKNLHYTFINFLLLIL